MSADDDVDEAKIATAGNSEAEFEEIREQVSFVSEVALLLIL